MTKTVMTMVELLVWAFRDCKVDEISENLVGPKTAMMRWDDAGAGIDHGPVPMDAFCVAAAVKTLPQISRNLVTSCAKAASHPDYMPGAKPIVAMLVNPRTGNPVRIYDEARHVIGHKVLPSVELSTGAVMYGWGQEQIDHMRALYGEWFQSLVLLRRHLDGRGDMEDHAVGGIGALRCPWLDGADLDELWGEKKCA